MSFSVPERKANAEEFLRRLWNDLGDRAIDEYGAIEPDDPQWGFVYSSTWHWLDSNLYLEQAAGGVYHIHAIGWRRMLELFAAKADVDARCYRLIKALKGAVKVTNRERAVIADPIRIALDANLPPGWTYNALVTNLLAGRFPDREYLVWIEGRHVRVPVSFGLDRFDLTGEGRSIVSEPSATPSAPFVRIQWKVTDGGIDAEIENLTEDPLGAPRLQLIDLKALSSGRFVALPGGYYFTAESPLDVWSMGVEAMYPPHTFTAPILEAEKPAMIPVIASDPFHPAERGQVGLMHFYEYSAWRFTFRFSSGAQTHDSILCLEPRQNDPPRIVPCPPTSG